MEVGREEEGGRRGWGEGGGGRGGFHVVIASLGRPMKRIKAAQIQKRNRSKQKFHKSEITAKWIAEGVQSLTLGGGWFCGGMSGSVNESDAGEEVMLGERMQIISQQQGEKRIASAKRHRIGPRKRKRHEKNWYD